MEELDKKLQIEQLDKKFAKLSVLNEYDLPAKGWIFSIRSALKIPLSQIAKKLNITAQSVKESEEREVNKTITLKKLADIADALEMRFVYAFVPKDSSLEKLIERKAYAAAKEIVLRTSHTMKLEEQENTEERINKAIKERAEKIKRKMPKYLWD
jgi:predicted DNA-binding mobile mystery protein A